MAFEFWSADPRVRVGFGNRSVPAARLTLYLPRDASAPAVRQGRWWQDTHEVVSLTIGHRESVRLTRSAKDRTPRQAHPGSPWLFPVPWRFLSHDHLSLRFGALSRTHAAADESASHGWILHVGPERPPTNPIYQRAWAETRWRRIDGSDVSVLSHQLNAFVLPFETVPGAVLTVETNGARLRSTRAIDGEHHDVTPPLAAPHSSQWPAKQLNAVIAVFSDALAWPPPPPRAESTMHVESVGPRGWDVLPARIKANWGAARKVDERRRLLGDRPAETDLAGFINRDILTYSRVFYATTVPPGDRDAFVDPSDPPEFRPPHLERVEFFR